MAEFRVIWSDADKRRKIPPDLLKDWKRRTKELSEFHGELVKE